MPSQEVLQALKGANSRGLALSHSYLGKTRALTLKERNESKDAAREYPSGWDGVKFFEEYVEISEVPMLDGKFRLWWENESDEEIESDLASVRAADFKIVNGRSLAIVKIEGIRAIVRPHWPQPPKNRPELDTPSVLDENATVRVYEAGVEVPLSEPLLAGRIYRFDVFLKGDDESKAPRLSLNYQDGWEDEALLKLQPLIRLAKKR